MAHLGLAIIDDTKVVSEKAILVARLPLPICVSLVNVFV